MTALRAESRTDVQIVAALRTQARSAETPALGAFIVSLEKEWRQHPPQSDNREHETSAKANQRLSATTADSDRAAPSRPAMSKAPPIHAQDTSGLKRIRMEAASSVISETVTYTSCSK